jgi:hypothetical protein
MERLRACRRNRGPHAVVSGARVLREARRTIASLRLCCSAVSARPRRPRRSRRTRPCNSRRSSLVRVGARAVGIEETRARRVRIARSPRSGGGVVDLMPDHDAGAASRRARGFARLAVAVAPTRTFAPDSARGSSRSSPGVAWARAGGIEWARAGAGRRTRRSSSISGRTAAARRYSSWYGQCRLSGTENTPTTPRARPACW